MPLEGSECHAVAVPALAGGLPPGQDDAAHRHPGGRAHGGIDFRVILDAAIREVGAQSVDVDHASSSRKADVHGAGRVGDGAGGDEIGAGFGVGADVLERDAAGEFDFGAAGDLSDPVARLRGREVVEQQVGGARSQRVAQFFARPDLDFDGQAGGGAGGGDGFAHSPGRGDVVVLDQNRVVKAHAVVGDAAGRRRLLFERAQSRRGLARIEHAAPGARDRIGVSARGGGDPAQALQEVERHPLAFEQQAGRPLYRWR